jgi:hypothetical protein
MKKNSNRKNYPHRRPVLADHTRQGKRLIPPLLKRGSLGEVRWVEDVVPELLWLGLLQDMHGYERAVELGVRLCTEAHRAHGSMRILTCSDFSRLGDAASLALRKSLRTTKHLSALEQALGVVAAHYPTFPLRCCISTKRSRACGEPDLLRLKSLLSNCFDRRGGHATKLQALFFMVALHSGAIAVPPGDARWDMANIDHYPNTDESRLSASALRAMVNANLGMRLESRPPWPSEFWQRGVVLEACLRRPHE